MKAKADGKNGKPEITNIPNKKVSLCLNFKIVNDMRWPSEGTVSVTDIQSGKELFKGIFGVAANSRVQAAAILKPEGQGMLLVRYEIEGQQYANHYLYGDPPFQPDEYRRWLQKTQIYPKQW
jgi:beta-mannosidase